MDLLLLVLMMALAPQTTIECPKDGEIKEIFRPAPGENVTHCDTRSVWRDGKWVEESTGNCWTNAVLCGKTERVCVKKSPGEASPKEETFKLPTVQVVGRGGAILAESGDILVYTSSEWKWVAPDGEKPKKAEK